MLPDAPEHYGTFQQFRCFGDSNLPAMFRIEVYSIELSPNTVLGLVRQIQLRNSVLLTSTVSNKVHLRRAVYGEQKVLAQLDIVQ